jgi:hypothetical protein
MTFLSKNLSSLRFLLVTLLSKIGVKVSTVKLVKPLRYDAYQDVQMRLHQTICRYKGIPVYVANTGHDVPGLPADNLGVHIKALNQSVDIDSVVVHSSDENLDITSVPLGWLGLPPDLDVDMAPLFLARGTRTSQKQGVAYGSIVVYNPISRAVSVGLQISGYTARALSRTIAGFSNPLHACLKLTYGGAINADWAVIRTSKGDSVFTLYHNSIAVGSLSTRSNLVLIRQGRLTKTRRLELQTILDNPESTKGVRYEIREQP